MTSAGVPGNWYYNKNNELEDYNGITFQYDNNGNTKQISSGTNDYYTYDEGDRLVTVEDGGGIVAEYYYDPFGRRLWKDDHTGGSPDRTYFLYSDEGLIGEYDSAGVENKVVSPIS